jgi:hypothetical protein
MTESGGRFSPRWAQIALLIADPRALSYDQIGQLMQPRLTKRTVKAYVREMAAWVDAREAAHDAQHDSRHAFPPRVQVLVWVRQIEWELKRPPSISDIIRASEQRDV